MFTDVPLFIGPGLCDPFHFSVSRYFITPSEHYSWFTLEEPKHGYSSRSMVGLGTDPVCVPEFSAGLYVMNNFVL